MPIRAIRRRTHAKRPRRLHQRRTPRRMPKRDGIRREIDLVRDIVPLVGLELGLPFALAADHPLQVGVGGSLFAADPAVFELGEVGFEEGDLVFVGGAGDVCGGAFDGEVVVDCALVYGGFCLRYQFSAPHV